VKIRNQQYQPIYWNIMAVFAAIGLLMFGANDAQALGGINLLKADGTPLPAGTTFRWLVEEDKTYHVPLNNNGTVEMINGVPALDPNWMIEQPLEDRRTLSVSFHRSYMPVVASGNQDDLRAKLRSLHQGPVTSGRNYYISVLPDSGYAISGASFKGNQRNIDVFVTAEPTPTAQITIFAHEDIAPINNVWDEGEEGIAGFSIILEDAGGKYGASAGIQSADVFGNPLCTTYNVDGSVAVMGSGCTTGPDGRVTIKNLSPGKYGIIVVPNNDSAWVQTSTIEGTKLIDAWVKANEPEFFGEFGPPGPHVSVGFVPLDPVTRTHKSEKLTGGSAVSGNVVNLHLSRPPDAQFYAGGPFPHTTPWVGLNEMAGGVLGDGLYAARTDDGSFTIPDVPPGDYQLVVWDDNLDIVFAKNTVSVADDGSCNGISGCNLGDVPVFQWFTRLENHVFNDVNEDGFRQVDEPGIPEQNVNLRFRDGTIYQAFPTDGEGFVPFDQAFPFFSWLVAEVDFANFKATGSTVTVDDGGPVPFGTALSFGDQLNPQKQNVPFDPDANVYGDPWTRTEVGPVLTHAFQGFLGQTSVIEWGKTLYGPQENGGISGMVMYAVTRAEDDPELAVAEPWEPGIPGVTVNLYDENGNFLMSTVTDSWDGSLPENCQHGVNDSDGFPGNETDDPYVFRGQPTDCYDGLRNWNQVRPGVFDGGYAFGPEFSISQDFFGVKPDWINIPDSSTPESADIGYMANGIYLVEVVVPDGYQIIRSQDKNVDFGAEYVPAPQLLPPVCVGTDYIVPDELSLFPGVPAPKAGQTLQTCDVKRIARSGFSNAAVDFSLFTEVPISGHIIGFILDDTANEYDPASPQFGEKYAPPFLPVSIRDWTGQEISRTVSDEYGVYNALVPSTYTENLPKPSGISPNMLTTCMNAKTRPDGTPDPLHNSQYSQFCYTFQYMPGSTTYLDTPVVPVAAFAGPDQNPLDCEFESGTPRIESVTVSGNNTVNGGPYIAASNSGLTNSGQTMTIRSMGRELVPNPAYDGVGGVDPKTVRRDYRFGGPNNEGTVTLDGITVPVTSWTQREITVDVSGINFGSIGGKQLTVTRANGNATVTGLTVQVGLRARSNIIEVAEGGSIQDAINNANPNDLILVGPGTYNEMVIMWKPVQLQGWGEGSTFIDAIKTPIEKLAAWRTLAESLLGDGTNGDIDLIPGQGLGFGGVEPTTFFSEEGSGVFVAAKNSGPNRFRIARNQGARIDGFNISGADTGGGVVVNGYADYLDISNLKIQNNSAFYAAGIRVGHPFVSLDGQPTDAANNYVNIHHNTVNQNGGLDGAGGGIGLHTGSDSYQVSNNFVCGNFTTADGAGIAHYGLSDRNNNNSSYPEISQNTVIFNENFNQGAPTNGGGILVAGKPAMITGDLSSGAGNVKIEGNLIQGNSAGAGDGGGIHLSRVNGEDVRIRGGANNQRVVVDYAVDIVNNIIVNNVAALAGGGISLQDALEVNIAYNTIAHNDNTSTSGSAFSPGIPSVSNPQPGAGIVSHAHLDLTLPAALPAFSSPILSNNIIWQNRMFYWLLEEAADETSVVTGLCPDIGGSAGLSCGSTVVYDDLAVIGTGNAADDLTCTNCLETNDTDDPAFVAGTFNGNRETTTFLPEVNTAIAAPPALDEGGNFIRLRYGPLTQTADFHIQAGSAAVNAGNNSFITRDFDLESRPESSGSISDIGADELHL
jgi:hypothetical protein